jgi:hypothetical protein
VHHQHEGVLSLSKPRELLGLGTLRNEAGWAAVSGHLRNHMLRDGLYMAYGAQAQRRSVAPARHTSCVMR